MYPVIRLPGDTPERQGVLDSARQSFDDVEQRKAMDGPIKMESGLGHAGGAGRAQGAQANTSHQQMYDSGLGDNSMETGYTDDTPMASNPNGNGTSFFNLDGNNYVQNNPSFLYAQPQVQPRNLFSNGSGGNVINNHDQIRRSPHRLDVKPNMDPSHYGIGIGEPGPSTFAQHRPGSRGTAASSSVSPVMTRHGTFRPAPMSQAVPVPASMPPPSPIGLRVGLTDAESDQAKSVPGSNKKPRRSAKPRASIASTSSVGDIGANFAGMGLMNDNGNNHNYQPHHQNQHQQPQQQNMASGLGGTAGMGHGMPFGYGMPYSTQTSTMPTPTGSNEEEDSSTKHWKVSYPPHNTLNK